MGVEKPPQSGKQAASSCHASSTAHQTATEDVDIVAPCHEQWLSGIFRKISPQKLKALARLLDSIGNELADSERN